MCKKLKDVITVIDVGMANKGLLQVPHQLPHPVRNLDMSIAGGGGRKFHEAVQASQKMFMLDEYWRVGSQDVIRLSQRPSKGGLHE
ncbi:hypothetical protein [Ewingella americana]|uniref:Uncharacterized protein n=1 Tax=Ewingella americana TaxID=41202 RepID=A0A502G6M6_9GAMM|nr:hypothetical protein [Ewingella americana]TPG56826.1 hypothetical protein EAH77_22400 [Ewingella americana]